MIAALDTLYSNNFFRSRLEARWAVYFDSLNTKWEYEKEGYELGDGIKYLPDFYLPEYNMYAEVKPIAFTSFEHDKCMRLAKFTERNVIELVGLPSIEPMDVIIPYKGKCCSKCGHSEYYNWDNELVSCECNAQIIETIKTEVIDAILLLKSDNISHIPLYFCTYMWDESLENRFIHEAIHKSKCARFEHGANGR